MRTKLVCLFILLFFFKSQAQLIHLSVGTGLNFPSGNSSNISAVGFQGYLKTEVTLSPKYALTATGGLSQFFGRRMFGVSNQTLSYVPVKVGFKYYTTEYFYVEGQLGAALPLKGSTKTALAWSPGLGTYFKSKNNNNRLDIGLRYEGYTSNTLIIPSGSIFSTFSFVGLHLGYVFSL